MGQRDNVGLHGRQQHRPVRRVAPVQHFRNLGCRRHVADTMYLKCRIQRHRERTQGSARHADNCILVGQPDPADRLPP